MGCVERGAAARHVLQILVIQLHIQDHTEPKGESERTTERQKTPREKTHPPTGRRRRQVTENEQTKHTVS